VPIDDLALVAQARAGSQQAYRDIVHRYERPIFNLIVRMVHDPASADDLSQETFLKAFSHLDSYDPRFKLSNWLFKIAHNTVIDFLRHRRPQMVSLDDPAGGGAAIAQSLSDPAIGHPLADLEHGEVAELLERALARLRPGYRQAVVLRYREDLTHEEIAEVMELPVGTVKSLLHRARAELAVHLEGLLRENEPLSDGAPRATGRAPRP
jgi:RNA polymerase sigma-70 factor (ECF subfamily)